MVEMKPVLNPASVVSASVARKFCNGRDIELNVLLVDEAKY